MSESRVFCFAVGAVGAALGAGIGWGEKGVAIAFIVIGAATCLMSVFQKRL